MYINPIFQQAERYHFKVTLVSLFFVKKIYLYIFVLLFVLLDDAISSQIADSSDKSVKYLGMLVTNDKMFSTNGGEN